ncbi:hypothetical protein AAMO2058_001252200 [Amorphochlora amoebiformis]|uniref:Elongin-C n=1 Tax=Amorphochlora amoebiformis TaxID=1561963 RepID=A0A7S0DMR6_9EUKA|mmetsp:Transcript_34861/g.56241  ORF Transcript_34861/g.56241 Transcript_34861/m.56241 type:complete len:115 (+) Transcript_34861:66-410(+)
MSLALDAEEPAETKDSKYIKLISKEGNEYICPKDVAIASGTIRRMLNGPGIWKENTGPIPTMKFETISSQVLEKVVQYFHYKKQYDNKKGTPGKFNIETEQIIPLLVAAHYLDT